MQLICGQKSGAPLVCAMQGSRLMVTQAAPQRSEPLQARLEKGRNARPDCWPAGGPAESWLYLQAKAACTSTAEHTGLHAAHLHTTTCQVGGADTPAQTCNRLCIQKVPATRAERSPPELSLQSCGALLPLSKFIAACCAAARDTGARLQTPVKPHKATASSLCSVSPLRASLKHASLGSRPAQVAKDTRCCAAQHSLGARGFSRQVMWLQKRLSQR